MTLDFITPQKYTFFISFVQKWENNIGQEEAERNDDFVKEIDELPKM
jgi:hypothetical protein